jgi:hypothetical protein
MQRNRSGYGKRFGRGRHPLSRKRGVAARNVPWGLQADYLPAGDHSYFAYLHPDDLDALHAESLQRSATIRRRRLTAPGGCARWPLGTINDNEMLVEGPTHHSAFGGPYMDGRTKVPDIEEW